MNKYHITKRGNKVNDGGKILTNHESITLTMRMGNSGDRRRKRQKENFNYMYM